MHDPVLESHHLVCEKPQTRRGIERRLALLLSATELFLEKGYDAVSLDDIVNHAGGSKTSIYKYFGNKDGLFTAICDYRREMFFKDICIAFQPEQTSLKDYLIQTLIRFYKHIIQPEHIAFLRLVIELTQCNATLSQYLYEKCALDVKIQLLKPYSYLINQVKLPVHLLIIPLLCILEFYVILNGE